jgi:hypothetical protein
MAEAPPILCIRVVEYIRSSLKKFDYLFIFFIKENVLPPRRDVVHWDHLPLYVRHMKSMLGVFAAYRASIYMHVDRHKIEVASVAVVDSRDISASVVGKCSLTTCHEIC